MNNVNELSVWTRVRLLPLMLAMGCGSSQSSATPSDGGVPSSDGAAPDSTDTAPQSGDGGTSGEDSGGATCSGSGAPTGPGATSIFSYSDGFASAPEFRPAWEAKVVGSAMELTYEPDGDHRGGSAWYQTQQNIQAFTTDFTFQQTAASIGMTFCIQNTNSTTNTNYGTQAIGDANGDGYGAYSFQPKSAIGNSVALAFDLGGDGQTIAVSPNAPSVTALFLNGAPYVDSKANAWIDLNPYGVGLGAGAGHVMAAHLVYDGALLTMVLRDTVTNAQARSSWPVDIPAATTSNEAWIGFTGGTVVAATQSVLTWDYATGYSPRLATPTFTVAAGSYPATQQVEICGSGGATLYYTTNGLEPTSASTKYTGPITVSASEIIKAVAIEAGYTDSLVASADYQIAPVGSPYPIDLADGFASGDGVGLVGYAQRKGSAIRLTDTSTVGTEVGAAWYCVPVDVQHFSTDFTLQFTSANANGMAFVIQNQAPASLDTTAGSAVSGGPAALGFTDGYGYAGLQASVAVAFGLYNSSANTTGLYLDGAFPTTSQVPTTGVALNSGHPLAVGLTYDGTTLSMKITDTVTSGTFSQSWMVDIPKTVGGTTAYVGFTGSTGGQYANQDVLSWTYAQAGSP